jgi:cytochrome c biogenesis protein CcmG, thiol:disulfide interchange protein DsbE
MVRRRSTRAIFLALVLLVPVTANCGGADGRTVQPPGVKAVNAATAPLLPDTADALPTFDFTKFQELGEQLGGVPVVVNIWSSWCGPCRDEAPALAAAAAEYGTQVQFVGVDILDDRGNATSFIHQYGWTYPSLFDSSGDIRDQLGFVGQPETLFYDSAGDLVSTWIGPISPQQLEEGLAAITTSGSHTAAAPNTGPAE